MIKKYANENDFHNKVFVINQINSSFDSQLTTNLDSKGKLDGRFVSLLKTVASFIPFVHLARTSPSAVAKVVSQFAVYHQKKGFFDTSDKELLLDSLTKLEQKVQEIKGKKYLKRHQKTIKIAYAKINGLAAKQKAGRMNPNPITPDGQGENPINPADLNKPNQTEPHAPKTEVKSFAEFTSNDSAQEYIFENLKSKNPKGLEKILAEGIKAKKLDVETKDEFNDSLLVVALTNKHYKVAKLLLKNGANPASRSSGGFTPLHFALQMTVKTENNNEKLIGTRRDYKILKLLLDKLPVKPTLETPIGPTGIVPYTIRTRLEEIKALNPKVAVELQKILRVK